MRFLKDFRLAAVVLSILITASSPAWAIDADAVSKQVNKDLRQAERLMFNGKNLEADALLKEIHQKIEEIRKEEPDYQSLKRLQSKYQRTRKQVDKKLPKNVQTQPTSVSKPETSHKPVQSKPHVSGSSSGYKQQMQNRAIKKVVKDVDYELGRAREELEPEGNIALPRSAEEKAKAALVYVQRAQGHLGKIQAKYPASTEGAGYQLAQEKIATVTDEIQKWKAAQQAHESQAATAAASVEADKASVMEIYQKDAQKMLSLHKQYHPAFEKIHGGTLIYEMQMPQVKEAMVLIEKAEKTIPEFSTELGRLADAYGTTSMDIYNNLHAKGYTLKHNEETRMAQLLQDVQNVAKSRKASANTLVEYASALLGAFSQQLNDVRIKRMQQAKEFLLAGQRMDAGNVKIQEMLAKIDDQMAEVAEKMEAIISAATWKSTITGFPGPGKAKSLAEDAKKYFENDRDWGQKPGKGVEILAVSVQGPWKVAETDVFGRVIQWRLPIHVAVTDNQLRPRNLARVYDLSIVAHQGVANQAPKKPPFDGYWVGDSWMMKLDKF